MQNSPDSNENTNMQGKKLLVIEWSRNETTKTTKTTKTKDWLGIVMDSGTFCGDEGIDLSLQKEKHLSNDSAKFRLFWERECNQCYQRIG